MAKRQKTQQKKRKAWLVYFDPEKLGRRLQNEGMSKTAIAFNTGLSRNTVHKAFDGEGVIMAKAKAIANELGVEDVNELTQNPKANSEVTRVNAGLGNSEWQFIRFHGKWAEASNGLRYRVCRLQHRFVDTRKGRGKWIEIGEVATDLQGDHEKYLSRHSDVSDRIGPHRHIADNFGCFSADGSEEWFVVDRWVGSETLASQLGGDRKWPGDLPQLMTGIAKGLEALHKAKIVFRELAPSRVLIAEDDGRAVLTEFELAKLLGKHVTVSNEWKEDEYRAPEVESGSADVRSDLYSWARVFLRAAWGYLPKKGQDQDAPVAVGLPKDVWRVVASCLSVLPRDRPKSIGQVLDVICEWQ